MVKQKPSDNNSEHDVQELLTAPLKNDSKFRKGLQVLKNNIVVSKFLNVPAIIWRLIHYPIKNFSWLSLLMVIAIVGGIATMVTFYRMKPTAQIAELDYKKYDKTQRLTELRASYDAFRNASALQHHIRWMVTFNGWKYKLDGDPKKKEGDCVGVMYHYLVSVWGANIPLESVGWLEKRCHNLMERGHLKERKDLASIRTSDIIIFNVSPSNQHVGLVLEVQNGWILYCDMGVKYQTAGIDSVRLGEMGTRVYELSFPLWIGDLLAEL